MQNCKTLIGLGKAFTFDEYGKIMLTPESKATAYAGAIICDKGNLDKLIFSGGKTQGEEYPSEAELMREHIYKNISKSIADFITLETGSKTTWSNARNTKRILEDNVNQKIGLLTIGYHLPRATKIFEREGFSNLIPLASENYSKGDFSTEISNSTLLSFVPKNYLKGDRLTEISNYLNSFKGGSERAKELMVRAFTFFFPDGKFLESIANKTRAD